MRMGLRGSRAALKLFAPHLDSASVERLDTGLRRFGQIFGTARDWDVFCLDTLPTATADLPAARLRDLNMAAKIEREVAHAAVVRAVRGQDFTALVLGLAVWAEAGAVQPCALGDERMGERLGCLAPLLLDCVASKAKKRGRHAGRLSMEKLHPFVGATIGGS
jgi:triphosphatase